MRRTNKQQFCIPAKPEKRRIFSMANKNKNNASGTVTIDTTTDVQTTLDATPVSAPETVVDAPFAGIGAADFAPEVDSENETDESSDESENDAIGLTGNETDAEALAKIDAYLEERVATCPKCKSTNWHIETKILFRAGFVPDSDVTETLESLVPLDADYNKQCEFLQPEESNNSHGSYYMAYCADCGKRAYRRTRHRLTIQYKRANGIAIDLSALRPKSQLRAMSESKRTETSAKLVDKLKALGLTAEQLAALIA